ncbi:hypothetical protein DB88DRAFT_481296 [Papiliotrema laurentii]|uniref:non-specific serine/threonine protein kinase n=1 Tax=Papiliotrema laurentii TaxID=5418 RepID=A0AAD9L7V2_PAPLA|nr:hypothetical protein DB88DRAFT_481296 [Papiliotrema laurentii]
MTSYNPLPSHLKAVQEEFGIASGGMATPSYGGTVETGAEWDYVIDKHGRKSRTPSRSPHRAATEPPVHRSSSLQHTYDPSTPNPLPSTSASTSFPTTQPSPNTNTFPSTMPHEPTIREVREEAAAAAVSRSVRAANGSGAAGSSRNGRDKPRGRMVGDWQLQKTLGSGSMGKVKLATNIHTKEKCAVKIIPRYSEATRKEKPINAEEAEKQRQKDESKEIRTVREAAISLLLHHPYICGMREFITHTNHHYMVCEFIDGGQMLDYIISHGRLRERAARKFVRQISSALDYCHRNSIVHRDLKIENILISKSGNIKIIDFGLSNLYAPDRHLSTFCGSLYFAAPELLNAKVYTGPEVDVWSFGIVLYVLVCGRVPFDDQSMPALHAKIKRGLVEYPAWLSSECKHLLGRMLVVNPADRATLTEVMHHPFMNKGYDGPPDSYVIHREPLRADELDWDVINAMGGFTFGTPEQIHDELRNVLTSESYLSVLSAWEARREKRRGPAASSSSMALSETSDSPKKKRFSGFDFKKKLFKDEKKVEESVVREKEPLDPTQGYNPLISIYYLAREKMEREKVYGRGHFASSQASLDNNPVASGYGMALPSLQPPASTHAMGYDPPSPRPSQFPQQSPSHPADFAGQPRARADDIPNPVMQHPGADRETSRLADLPSAHHRDAPPSPLQPSAMDRGEDASRKFPFLGKRQPSISRKSPSTSRSASRGEMNASQSLPSDPRRSTTVSDKKQERRVSVGSISNSMGRVTLGRRGSQRKPASPPDAEGYLGSPREADEVESGTGAASTAVERDLNEEHDTSLETYDAKPVYLKGLFSVSTTSTKPAAVLIKDIATVLERIGIKFRPIKGGFECVHVPSIDLNSVVNGDEANTSLPNVPTDSQQGSTASRRKPSLRRKSSKGNLNASRGASPMRQGGTGYGGSSGTFSAHGVNGSSHGNDLAATTQSGQPVTPKRAEEDDGDWLPPSARGSSLIVRFEIYVVKVPWLPLHGIQFRRVGGDGWQYQMLAKTILKEMRL